MERTRNQATVSLSPEDGGSSEGQGGQNAFWRKGTSWAGKDLRLVLLTPGADGLPCPSLPLGTSGSGAKTGEDTISAFCPGCCLCTQVCGKAPPATDSPNDPLPVTAAPLQL